MSQQTIFKCDPDLEIKDELISVHAINPFIANLSASRGAMVSSHLSQTLPITYNEPKIIQTGLEKQFVDIAICKKIHNDVKVVRVIDRYRGIGATSVEKIIITQDIRSGEYSFTNVPYYQITSQTSAFKYTPNHDLLNKLRPGYILEEGTVLATPPSVKDGTYNFGLNANICLLNIPETAEDGVIISESLSNRLSYTTFETINVKFGTNNYPLNLYGDKDNYKVFPDIGETVNDDQIIIGLREYNTLTSPIISGLNDTRTHNTIFDKCVYAKGPGKEVNIFGNMVKSSIVRDIKVFYNNRTRKKLYTQMDNQLNMYKDMLLLFYKDILDTYEEMKADHHTRTGNYDVKMSASLHRLIMEAMFVANPYNHKLTYVFKNERLDLYQVSITLEHTIKPQKGHKISCLSGAKGVIVDVWKDEDMPTDTVTGVRSDIIQDPKSVAARMIPSWSYEQYFGAMSRKCKDLVIASLGGVKAVNEYTDQQIQEAFKIILGLLELIGTEQYEAYNKCSIADMRNIIDEAIHKEVYILYRVSSKKKPYQIVMDSKDTIYKPDLNSVRFKIGDREYVTKSPVMIAPSYTLLLSKTADKFSSTSSSKLNHYSIPISISAANRNFLPYRDSPTRILSETEQRLITSYVGREAIAEIKDRANSVGTHKSIYKSILEADKPTNIDNLIDRKVQPYGGDAALEFINNIFNPGGISIDYVPGDDS